MKRRRRRGKKMRREQNEKAKWRKRIGDVWKRKEIRKDNNREKKNRVLRSMEKK